MRCGLPLRSADACAHLFGPCDKPLPNSATSQRSTPGESGATTVYSNPETVVVAPPTAASGPAPKLRGVTWLEPTLHVEVTYSELIEGRQRDSVYRGLVRMSGTQR
jgi:hypothetical protein